jgi:hypothetical protein
MDPEIERLEGLITALTLRIAALESPPCCPRPITWGHLPSCPHFDEVI